ncbi:hypothetical protein [Demequina gelatinilytica]|uniref:hypothetical protein n=1 Tax=Demequina gelatinilytica TaxID=1638980 RepID=UPI000781BA24|nr:hypothetical protein [Demequina gelatinilytica]
MSWLRTGDTAAHDPRTLAPLDLEDADERTVDEVFGFSCRLALEAGSKETDRKVTLGMVRSLAGSPARAQHLMGMLVYAKVWKPIDGGWELINDPAYLHLRGQDDIDNDRIRARDRRDDRLVVYARLRDGDNCRYCSNPVNWRDRKSLRGAEYDHVNIANQPTVLDEFVVSCRDCNGDHANKGDLLPPPEHPVYGAVTKEFIKTRLGTFPTRAKIAEMLNGQRTTPVENATDRQRTTSENATGTHGQRPKMENATAGQRTTRAENATETPGPTTDPPDLRQITDPGGVGTRSVGSGRDGTSSYGPDLDSPGSMPRPRRSRRHRPKPQPTTEV